MKKNLIIYLIIISILIVGCSKQKSMTKEEVLSIIEDKGIENVDWEDFDKIEHEDVGSGRLIYEFKLKDGVKLYLNGNDLDEKPLSIYLVENGETTYLKNE